MRLKISILAIVSIFFTFLSCDKIPFLKKETQIPLDTILNLSSVDSSPTFKECDSLINKNRQSFCFRKQIHQKVVENLAKHSFQVSTAIDEEVTVFILISNKGEFKLQEVNSSAIIKEQLPKLDSLLNIAIKSLPTVFPAIKRSIPVTTRYKLPIKIKLEE